MCEGFAKIWTIVILLIAIILLQGDIIPTPFSPKRGVNSPCECLTGVFADNALAIALRRESLFIGIHWRESHSRVFPFFDPWSLKYDNCLTLHELYIPFHTIELNGSEKKMKDWNTSAVEEALYRQMENDITNDGNSKSNGLTMRDSGLFANQRVWWRRRGRISSSLSSSSSVYGRIPSCHVWILPETTLIPLEVWMALRGLLENGTLAGKSIHFSSDSVNNNNKKKKKRELWSQYQPLGVLLWADSNDRKSLKRMVPDSIITMFTTIRQ